MSTLANDLETGFEILWYKIDSVLGRGGFGITYLAEDTNLHQKVAIKEYLPHDFAARSGDSTVQPASVEQTDIYSWGLERFMSEAQTLAKFKHHNIVRVSSVFKHNNTGYMVMEYEVGRDLNVIFQEKKKLTQPELEAIYYPIMDGLASVHKEGFIHRDIKPANIYIREDGSPVLLDFGAARQAVGGKTQTLTSMLSVGYAPFEQYNDGSGKQGPWTDIYALSACLHQGITGQKPSESTLRGMALLHDEPDPYEPLSHRTIEGYSDDFLRAIDQGLMLQIHDRPQTLEQFMGMLKGEIKLEDLPPRDQKEAPGYNERTVIRPVKRVIKDSAVTATEKMDSVVEPTPVASEQVPVEPVSEKPDAKFINKLLPHKTKVFAAAGILVLLIIAAILLQPEEKSPEQLRLLQIETLIEQADDLFNDGIYYHKDQDNALALYQQVLSMDAQNEAASNGIDKSGHQLLAQAEQSIAENNYAQANEILKIVATVKSDFPGLISLQKDLYSLVESEKKFKQIDILLGNAQKAIEKNQIYQPEAKSAYAYYQQVLVLDSGNVAALLGLSEVSDFMLIDANKALSNKKYVEAKRLVAQAESINPDNPSLKDIKLKLSAASELDQLITRADKAYERQQYTTPATNSALALYNEVLSLSPNNTHAITSIQKMADFYANKASSQIRSGNLNSARANIRTLDNFFPDFTGSSKLKRDLDKKQRQLNSKKVDPVKNIRHLIPVGINQKQDDNVVVQDIVGLFIKHFKNRDIRNLKKVAQLNKQQENLYSSMFSLYKSINLKLVPKTFTVNKKKGLASVNFQISDLVDKNGNTVQTTANWTKIKLSITKKSGMWLKSEINKP